MSLNIKYLTFGDLIAFVPDGSNLTNESGAVVSSSLIKPDGTTASDWAAFSSVEKGAISGKFTDEEVMGPSPGAYRRLDVIRSMVAHDIKITCQEVNEIILQSVFQSGVLANTKVSIQTALGQVRGWLRITRSSQKDATALLLEVYGILSVKDLNADGKLVKPEVDFSVLYNPLNVITPSLAAA